MIETNISAETRSIVVEDVFPHAPETLWKALTDGALMARWLMEPSGFEPRVGNQFTYRTTPAGEWDGTIRCEVTELVPNERFSYRWQGGHASNQGYGAPLDTLVTFELAPVANGTRLRLIHSGFVLPRNETAFNGMSKGWAGVVGKIGSMAGELN